MKVKILPGEPLMIATTEPAPAQRVLADFQPALKNTSVALCAEVWEKIFRATLERNKNVYTAKRCADAAYRTAMPPLSGFQEIRDFIACVGYGMLLGAIKAENGTKLVYAAQVALAALPKHSRPSKPHKTKPKTSTGVGKKLDPATPRTMAATPSNQ